MGVVEQDFPTDDTERNVGDGLNDGGVLSRNAERTTVRWPRDCDEVETQGQGDIDQLVARNDEETVSDLRGGRLPL